MIEKNSFVDHCVCIYAYLPLVYIHVSHDHLHNIIMLVSYTLQGAMSILLFQLTQVGITQSTVLVTILVWLTVVAIIMLLHIGC